jgi:mono/diheme cytochrome c family protein
MRRHILAILSSLAASIPAASSSSAAENADAGRTIAETWCRPCHAIGTPPTSDIAPPFGDIVSRRTPQEIASFLADPHGRMPSIQLARPQIADIIAFMATLK